MISKLNLLSIVSITNNLKVLYVEDNKESRIQALKMLENYFSYIDIAVDGADGLECYKNYFLDTNEFYDIVISDIQMPKMDGISMSRAIYEINKDQKIIIISAYNDKKHLIDLINMGVEGFLQKPLSFEQVSDALNQLCKSFVNDGIITLAKNCTYNKLSKELSLDGQKINITRNEQKFIEFLIKNHNSTSIIEDIFNHIFYDEPQKKFTADSIKGLVKRLRKKLPDDLILHNRTTGYSIDID
ncbi:MAG: response regulator transcription factor [Arcobacteraceae bacterium]|nr:response regulator transcription factor [Arcobacteraceae bacterium]